MRVNTWTRISIALGVALAVGCQPVAVDPSSSQPTFVGSPGATSSEVPGLEPSAAPNPAPTPDPTDQSPSPTPTTAATAPNPTSTAPTELPVLNGPFDLATLQWTTVTEPFSGDLEQEISGLFLNPAGEIVAWGRDQEWVGPGHGEATTTFWTSPDGAEWRDERIGELGSNQFINDVAAGQAGHVAVGYAFSTAAAWWSEDGETWTRASRGPDDRARGLHVGAVAAGPDGFLAVGSDHQKGAAWFSPDGNIWEPVEQSFPEGSLEAVASAVDGGFVAVGVDRSQRGWDGVAWRVSSNGRRWTPASANDSLAGPEDEELDRLWAFNGGYMSFGQQVDTEERIECYRGGAAQIASLPTVVLARSCYWGYSSWRTFHSQDGGDWEMADPDVETYVLGQPDFWEYEAIGRWGDGLIAVGAGTDWQIRVWLSADGFDWTPVGEPVLVNGEPAPEEWQDDTVDALVVDHDRLIIGGDLSEPSDGYVMIGVPNI